MDVPNCGTEDYAAAKRQLEFAAKVGPTDEGTHAVAMAEVHARLAQTAVWAAFGLDDMVEPARTEWATTLGLTLDAASAPPEFAEQVKAAVMELFTVGTAEDIIESDAFGALVYRLREYCDPNAGVAGIVNTFKLALTDGDLAFCGTAEDPAAFLAAKVRDLL